LLAEKFICASLTPSVLNKIQYLAVIIISNIDKNDITKIPTQTVRTRFRFIGLDDGFGTLKKQDSNVTYC
jgi:hypothetical protein